MQTQNTKHLLDKINGLHQSISTDEQISSIERDLMLSYIRQLYDTYVSMPVVIEHVTNALPNVVPPASFVEKVQEKTIEVEVEKAVVPPIVYLEPELKIEPKPEPKPEPIFIEPTIEEAPVYEQEIVIVPPAILEVAMPSLAVAPPKIEIGSKAAPLIQPNNIRVDDDELFDQNAKKELSDKLGETPIEDIKRSMGINERILTQNELFAGDNFEFENAVARLQNMNDFEAAKNYLLQLAQRYDWASKEKFAKPFIKLVRRKFNK